MAVFTKLRSLLGKVGSVGVLAAGAAWLTLSAGVFGQRVTSDDVRPDFFPFSVWYSGGKARAPMLEAIDEGSRERWKQDLLQIRRLGFNTVRTWVEWTANEPRPGEYDFSHLRLLAELAQEVGLKFFVQVYTDSAPDWVGAEWEDARFVAQNGAAIPSQAAPGYCFDHPEVRRKILDFYRAAARVASSYPNFAGWDLWSEPHVINWAIIDYIPNASFCYCPSSIRRFREWLRSKYGSFEVLNRRWYRTFTDWNQVEPPRFGTILSYTDSMKGLSGRLVTPIVGTGIREELLPAEGTEVLGRFEDGSPALTVRRFGRGRAYMAGSFLSIANGQADRESNDRVFQAIARDAGAGPVLGIDLPVTDPPCEIRLVRAADASLIYLFNHSTEKVSVPLPFEHLTDLERDQPLSGANVVLQPGEIRALLGR